MTSVYPQHTAGGPTPLDFRVIVSKGATVDDAPSRIRIENMRFPSSLLSPGGNPISAKEYNVRCGPCHLRYGLNCSPLREASSGRVAPFEELIAKRRLRRVGERSDSPARNRMAR